jgi:Lactonase, 7-bladed beta-propeller
MARQPTHPGRFRLPTALVAAMATLAIACGGADRDPLSPAAPSTSPTTAPPSAFAFVTDRETRELLAFDANAATGALRLVEGQDLGYPQRLAVDPLGRFVYASATISDRSFLRSYAVEAATGRLTLCDEEDLIARALSIAATETLVHVIGAARTTGYIGYWSVYGIDTGSGTLEWMGPGPWRRDPFFMVAGPRGEEVYTVAHESPALGWTELLYASDALDDGVIVDRDVIKLQYETSDVVLGGDVLFTADRAGRISSRTLREAASQIKLLARLEHAFEGGPARLALGRPTIPRLSASSVAAGTLLAVSSASGVRTFAVSETGELSLAGSVTLPGVENARAVAFHPSGRHLYTSGPGEGIRIFRVEENGLLQETAREPRGGGEIVITAPPG